MEDNVAAPLPLNNQAYFLEHANQVAAGKVGWNFGHGSDVVTSTYSRSASTGIASPASRTSSK